MHHVEALAITDPLTGLFNRRRFADVLERELAVTQALPEHAPRLDDRPRAVLTKAELCFGEERLRVTTASTGVATHSRQQQRRRQRAKARALW